MWPCSGVLARGSAKRTPKRVSMRLFLATSEGGSRLWTRASKWSHFHFPLVIQEITLFKFKWQVKLPSTSKLQNPYSKYGEVQSRTGLIKVLVAGQKPRPKLSTCSSVFWDRQTEKEDNFEPLWMSTIFFLKDGQLTSPNKGPNRKVL